MIIKDQLHGTIEFDELEGRIIDTATFQRLRRIKQMSITNLVYPGANHSRFEHSIGTAHLSEIIARRVGLDEDEIKKVKLYGLLHDIGHTAFSHEGEDVVKKYIGDHEELGRRKMVKGEIADLLSENYKPAEIADIEKSGHGSIIDSALGADRMDYLKRDAINTGVAYGLIDTDRIVHTLEMKDGQLCISKGGLEAAEYLLIARFMMFSTVYLHRTVRIATAMLYRAIEGAIEDKTLKPEQLAEMDDESALTTMARSGKGAPYAKALLQRRLYKEVCSVPKEGWSIEKAQSVGKELSKRFNCDMIVDYPHEFFKPVEFKVDTGNGLRPIAELSELVRSLKKAEEGRMRVLVLAEENVREKKGQDIEKAVSPLRS
ncbi:MAG: HD domain-containing protein [Candidatus ainarchaeum sp.]|nr:HD domain-containing protein [Candidatus ainarchaeum sp.]